MEKDLTLEEVAQRFRKLPEWLFKYRVVEVLSGVAIKVLIILINRADFNTNCGGMRKKQIRKEAGISDASVVKALEELVKFGIIEIWFKGHMRCYRILKVPPDNIGFKVDEALENKKDKKRKRDHSNVDGEENQV